MRNFGLLMILIATVILVSGEYAAESRYQQFADTTYRHHIDVMMP